MADEVQVIEIDMADLAIELNGPEHFEQPNVYSFGGGKREFKDKGEDSALYNPPPEE
jgi:hypothetical protein